MDLDRRLIVRGLVVALLVEHLLLVVKPLNVLAPVDPWVIGQHLLHGDLPYRDFAFEYPPLAALAFVLPGAATHGAALSVLAFEEVVVEAAMVVLVFTGRRAALLRYGVLSLFVFPFISGGFDALPMAALAASTWLLTAENGWGWAVAGAGALVKVSPGVVWVWGRTRWRAAVAALAVTVAVALVPLSVARDATSSYLGYALKRGVQVESVAASTTWVAHRIEGAPDHFAYRFKSWQIAHGGAEATAWEAVALVGMAALFIAARRRQLDPWLASLAAVLLFLCGSKVFSPQFVAWGAPLAAVVGGRWFVAYLAVAALTFLAYVVPSGPGAILGFALVRNAVVVTTAALALQRVMSPA